MNARFLMYNVPLILNFNFGAGSSKGNERKFGFFFGGGYGFFHRGLECTFFRSTGGYILSSEKEFHQTNVVNIFSPMLNGGIRFNLPPHYRKNIEIKFLIMNIAPHPKSTISGLGCIFNFTSLIV